LGLDSWHKYVLGALPALAGGIMAASTIPSRASSVRGRVGELIRLADDLCAQAGVSREAVTQTVIGSPGVYDPRRNAMALTGGLPGWDRPAVLADLRAAFGQSLVVENDGRRGPRRAHPWARPGRRQFRRSSRSAAGSAWARWSAAPAPQARRAGRSPTADLRRPGR
jgi:hypothetical protein